MERISFSIVVVCLNPGEKLGRTVRSVLAQDYGDYEILVKDGGSSDGSAKGLPADSRIRLVSCADKGIYDAMNQALPLLTGQYVLFLNCGDTLSSVHVLSRMADAIGSENRKNGGRHGLAAPCRIFYGDQYNLKQKSAVYSAPKVDDLTCYRNVPCHQVCFYDARLFEERGYLTEYRVRADYEHFLYCIYERGAQAVYVRGAVADYEGGGFSETKENRKLSSKEHRKIALHYLGRRKVLLFEALMLLTLAPVRTRLAESPRFAGYYNGLKAALYGAGKKGRKDR